MLTSARNAVAAVAAVCAIAGCGSSAAFPAQPAPYSVLITEPSQNLTNDTRGSLIAYWSCAPDADPRARFSSLTGGLSQEDYAVEHAKWTEVPGETGLGSLRVDVTCQPGDTITVAMDAAVVAYRPTTLRCEIFAPSGERIAAEEATRPEPAPVCRAVVGR
jgi:hypothetical protein